MNRWHVSWHLTASHSAASPELALRRVVRWLRRGLARHHQSARPTRDGQLLVRPEHRYPTEAPRAVISGNGPKSLPNAPTLIDGTPSKAAQQVQQLVAQAQHQHASDAHQLLVQSVIALAIMAVVSVGLGWLVAGRALRPLRTITTAARNISASNLHQRLALSGPERRAQGTRRHVRRADCATRPFLPVATAVRRQRLARVAYTADVAARVARSSAARSRPSLQGWRAAGVRALAANQEQERLIAALLTLARSERGLSHCEPFDLSVVTTEVLAGREADFDQRGLHLSASLDAAPTTGDPALAERLVANLIDNASRHNVRGGRVEVTTAVQGSDAVLSVRNTGAVRCCLRNRPALRALPAGDL